MVAKRAVLVVLFWAAWAQAAGAAHQIAVRYHSDTTGRDGEVCVTDIEVDPSEREIMRTTFSLSDPTVEWTFGPESGYAEAPDTTWWIEWKGYSSTEKAHFSPYSFHGKVGDKVVSNSVATANDKMFSSEWKWTYRVKATKKGCEKEVTDPQVIFKKDTTAQAIDVLVAVAVSGLLVAIVFRFMLWSGRFGWRD